MKNQIIKQTNVPDTREEGIQLIELYEELDYRTDGCTKHIKKELNQLNFMKNQIIEQTDVPDTRKEGIELIELYEELDYRTDECTRHT